VDERGKSNIRQLCNNLLKTLDGRGGSVVTDSYRLSKGDIALLSDYPVKSYSFSRPWSRIIPLGGRDSPVNHNGIELYSKFISQTVSPICSTCRSLRIRFNSLHTLDNVLTVSSKSTVLGTCHFRFIYRRMHRLLRPTFKGSFDEYLFYPLRYIPHLLDTGKASLNTNSFSCRLPSAFSASSVNAMSRATI